MILWLKFKDEIRPYLELIEKYAKYRCRGVGVKDFIREGVWKSRIGGHSLKVPERVNIIEEGDMIKFIVDCNHNSLNWYEWFKPVGNVVIRDSYGYIEVDGSYYRFNFQRSEKLEITFKGLPKEILYHIKRSIYKIAYCIRCGACEIECPKSAIKIGDVVKVDERKCIKCHRCLYFVNRGCIVADSYRIGLVVNKMSEKSLSRYKTFGMRKEWLEEFFADPKRWWNKNRLGPIQFEAMKHWLMDAEIIEKGSLTEIGKILRRLGITNLLTWSVIWVNLAENSPLIEWYVQRLQWGRIYSKEELFNALGDHYRDRTKKNAIATLLQLFNYTPFGDELSLGVPIRKGKNVIGIEKKGVPASKMHPIAVLYSLYKYAENVSRYYLTVSELYEESCVGGPYKLFGISRKDLERIMIGLKETFGSEVITVELSADLDNINLNEDLHSIDILKLVR